MFDSKLSSLYRISNGFAKWACIFCKLLPENDILIRNRLLELSQSVPVNIAAAGGSQITPAEKQRHFKCALQCAIEYSTMLTSLHSPASADMEIIKEGRDIIDTLIALLTEEATVTMLTNEPLAAPAPPVGTSA